MAHFLRNFRKLPLYAGIRHKSSAATFKASDTQIQLCNETQKKPKPDPDTLTFGREFSDHMLEVEWSAEGGWKKPIISPLHNFSIHPAAKVFHYSVELFEGMKAYRCEDQSVKLFRPDMNAKRMLSSAKRASLPEFEEDELVECIRKLISIDKEWVPYSSSSTLYIRPTFIGTDPCLGVSQSQHALLYVISGPVGPYYPTGFKPVSLLADPQFVRAWSGGCGGFKLGSNYGPTIFIQQEAAKRGCQQVLWLYGPDHNITEAGTMNFFMYWINEKGENELLTPPLDSGLILPGVTRQSLVDLAREWGEFTVTEREFTMKELVKALKEERILEVFGAGTACVVSPVEKIMYMDQELMIPTMDKGAPITTRFHEELLDIQFGRKPSKWSVAIE